MDKNQMDGMIKNIYSMVKIFSDRYDNNVMTDNDLKFFKSIHDLMFSHLKDETGNVKLSNTLTVIYNFADLVKVSICDNGSSLSGEVEVSSNKISIDADNLKQILNYYNNKYSDK